MRTRTHHHHSTNYSQGLQGVKVEVPADLQEWMSALNVRKESDEGLTVAELAEQHGIPRSTMRNKADKAVRAGTLLRGTAIRQDDSGRNYHATVYRLAKPEDK